MSPLHRHEVAGYLTRFLDRRDTPRRLADKPDLASEEITALAGTIARFAPPGRLVEWWPAFEARLGETIKGTSWPTQQEAAAVAKETAVVEHVGPAAEFQIDPPAIAARRIAAGEPVGVGALWGADAVQMGVRRLVTAEAVEAYRKAAIAERAKLYSEADVDRWVDARTTEHRAAIQAHRDRRQQQATGGGIDREMAGRIARALSRYEANSIPRGNG